jgi:primosomal protein N' (replication factor Y)
MYAEIAVNVASLAGTFHFQVPTDLEETLRAGHLVTVPFGSRDAQGVIVGLGDDEPEGVDLNRLRPVIDLIDPEPVLTVGQLDLAYWLSRTYLIPLIDAITLMFPPGLAKQAESVFSLAIEDAPAKNPLQARLLTLIRERGSLRSGQLDHALPRTNWRAAADSLVRAGVLRKVTRLEPPRLNAKHIRTARRVTNVPRPSGPLSRTAAKHARLTAALDYLESERKPAELSWVYAASGATLQDLKDLQERGLIDLNSVEVWRDPLAGKQFVADQAPRLTADQLKAWQQLAQALATPPSGVLVYGVTGAGKTELYLRAIDQVLAEGGRAIVLVPEIALTPQTVRRFAARFPGRVAVWHSELNEGERYDTWRRARAGLVDVVIGARSALFAPLPDLKLIILDEEHDEAYKQDPPQGAPYHAREAALRYAQLISGTCLLGSATPDVTTTFRARRGDLHLIELPRRIMGHARSIHAQAERLGLDSRYVPVSDEAESIDLPPVEVVDMRQELRMGNVGTFSRKLLEALGKTLSQRRQAILFLNRRGTATYIFCRDCGQPLKCPNCDSTLIHHATAANLQCHHCGHSQPPPDGCPNCHSKRVKYFGLGTEKLADDARAAFPGATVLRWDRDMTRTKGAHELILHQFSSGQADVLVGTQMIAKGLDLPLVTLVGVISADVGLGLPDYRAAERNFQLLTQVAGRAGRSLLGGRVILQTYQPEHFVIAAAAQHDYLGFYARELEHRKDLGYPPFRRVLRLLYRHADAAQAEHTATLVATQLRLAIKDHGQQAATDIAGPAPAFFGKIANEYRWQILLRGPDPAKLVRPLNLAKGWVVDVDPLNTL